jgi:hypothetical protein
MKQSAVEWLIDEFNLEFRFQNFKKTLEQAKEMEKQQIIDAHLCGLIYPLESEASKQAEEYYNETFNKPTL